ncbi:MAG: SDR family NAD(P)-dependent oxidoreductase [Anaerolineales bacterium]
MILDKFRLDGKIAIVTGSRRNLGKGMAIGLAEAGADIVSFDRNDPTETRQAVEALGRRHLWKQVDLLTATPEDFTLLIEDVVSELGSVDILVNNAGICPREDVLDYPVEYWNNTLQTNLMAPWFLAQAAARQMVKQGGGKIINIASLLSHQGGTIVPGYTASKHGILGITKALANDLASKGVNVNSITPGYMHTDMTDPLVGNPQFNLEARMPAKRCGSRRRRRLACVVMQVLISVDTA